QVVDPRAGTVRILGRLGHGLSHASALVVGGELLIAGGRTSGRAQSSVWRLDPVTGGITLAGHLPYAVSDMATAVVAGTGYLIGGEGSAFDSSIITVSVR
ncbi:MAG TPA: kelch repeat-containing protein, partial [Candidatus Acidoferrum sp.]|nr:kelch repeat-containing protein [Candidatus Acidoferrum sp.]